MGMDLMEFFHLMEQLKTISRRGWVIRDIPNPESDSDHMHRMGLMALTLKNPGDRFKTVKMALVHDAGEWLGGDIIPSDGIPKGPKPLLKTLFSYNNSEADKKYQQEKLAFDYLSICLTETNPDFAIEMRDLFVEFETGETFEAKLVGDLDIYERALQAYEYEKRSLGEKRLDDMVEDLDELVTTEIQGWAETLLEERKSFWLRRSVPIFAIYVIGGPGVGKGTQCARFASQFNAHHISAGELLREEQNRTDSKYSELIGRHISLGITVPASLTIKLLKRKMDEASALGKKVFLLDGFPRSKEQAIAFEETFCSKPPTIILCCPAETQLARLRQRAELSGRADDESEDKRAQRVKVFEAQNAPVVVYLQNRLTEIQCEASQDAVSKQFEKTVQELKEQML